MFTKVGIIILLVGAISAEQLRGDDVPLTREKRQIPTPNFPTFGPDVQRTADGVPILDESYLDRRDRPARAFFSQFEQNPTETEGLRLYDSLISGGSSGGRPQVRSLDNEEHPFADLPELQNGSGSRSGSYTRKTHSRRTSRKSIQVKSSNSNGGGVATTSNAAGLRSLHGAGSLSGSSNQIIEPHFSEEVNYQRTSNANKRRNSQLRSLDSNGENTHSCVTCRRSRSEEAPGATELKTLTRSSTTNSRGHETEGLRLYRKLLTNGGGVRRSQNQLRSLDNNEDDQIPQNGILPHHRQSAAWSEKKESHYSRNTSTSNIQLKSGDTLSELPSGFGPSTGPQFSDEINYSRSNSGRRSHTRNASQTRSLSSNTQGSGRSNCVTCQTRSSSSSSLVDESPVTYHRSSRVPNTGDFLIPTQASSSTGGSSSWAEREERSHHSSRTVSKTINGVETNGLGEPLHSEETANYRRVASGGNLNNNNNGATTRSNLRTGARTLSNYDHAAANTHSTTSEHTTNNNNRAASRLTVAGLGNGNSNSRSSRRYNCSRISTTNLSEGAQSVTEIITPPPCQIRRSSSDNQLNTRSISNHNLLFPPVQTFGRGDQEVHARVLESDHESDSAFNQHSQQQQHRSTSEHEQSEAEDHEESSRSASIIPTQTSFSTGKKSRKAYYRRQVYKNYTTQEYPASIETWLGA